MRLVLLRFTALLLGAFLGWVVYCAAGNTENWSFYTLRSAVTGETVMSRIVDHPADRWVKWAVLLTPACIGATSSLLIFECIRRRRTNRPA